MAGIDPDSLIAFAAAVLGAYRVPEDDAQLFADSLVQADLWGHQSHGIMRLPWYAARLDSGVMGAATRPEVVSEFGAIQVIDGRDGIGQVLAAAAITEAVRRAKAHGVGAVAVRNSNHFGTAMYFTRMAAAEGCIGLLTTNASPAMAPWGGRRRAVGNNPWSIAAPGGRFGTVVLDIANTAVARGKLYLARQRGEEIPLGWAMDADGRPTTDPAAGIAGLILPMGEHKGYGIAVMMDVLSGVLSGSAFLGGVFGPYQSQQPSGSGHLALALDIGAFRPVRAFEEDIERMVTELKAVPPAAGWDEVYYPGEIEARADAANRANGLELPDDTLSDLRRLADKLDLAAALPF
ncbi:MAG: Ldh family oxidoreductase [Alphaproteobacteria bacterium]|nr:Ldh family oxidoreductase [Alphaproteobacteria bacterium]